jgi:hypothetical protein
MEKFLWIPHIIRDMAHFCGQNDLLETKEALEATMDAFGSDMKIIQISEDLPLFVNFPDASEPSSTAVTSDLGLHQADT